MKMKSVCVAFVMVCFALSMIGQIAVAADTVVHSDDSIEVIKNNLASGKAVFVDVREPEEWKDGHLKQAKLVPLRSIFKGLSDEELQRSMPGDKIVYIHCASGVRSLDAARKLKERHPDLRPLKQGYKTLVKAGFEPAES